LLLLQVTEVLDDTRLLARCLNTHKLGQRKNCNLPGVVSDLPVLGPKDVDDVQNFAAKHGMDYVFASFVQSADDVRMIRKVSWASGSSYSSSHKVQGAP
jgi:pyruvate kinase